MLIYDALGNLKTPEWLQAKYGQVTLHTDAGHTSKGRMSLAAPCWRVFALVEDAEYPNQAGPARPVPNWWPKPLAAAALVAKTLSEAGEPVAQVPVARYWPDAPLLPPEQALWQPRGVIGYTNGQGDTGFGMGNGDYYTPPAQTGASWIWVAQPGIASEAVSGLGMLAGTNHSHMNVVFRYDSAPPEPPAEDPLLALVRDIKEAVLRILETLPVTGKK
jgi:hypothetical protein